MEVMYHFSDHILGGISPYIAPKNRPYTWNRYLHGPIKPGNASSPDFDGNSTLDFDGFCWQDHLKRGTFHDNKEYVSYTLW